MALEHNGEEILLKSSTPEYRSTNVCTNVTDIRQTNNRRICDSKDPKVT